MDLIVWDPSRRLGICEHREHRAATIEHEPPITCLECPWLTWQLVRSHGVVLDGSPT